MSTRPNRPIPKGRPYLGRSWGVSESSFDYPPTNERRCAFQSRIKYTSKGEHFYASRRDHGRFNRNSLGSRHYEGDDKSPSGSRHPVISNRTHVSDLPVATLYELTKSLEPSQQEAPCRAMMRTSGKSPPLSPPRWR